MYRMGTLPDVVWKNSLIVIPEIPEIQRLMPINNKNLHLFLYIYITKLYMP